jgi:hypothetical protein
MTTPTPLSRDQQLAALREERTKLTESLESNRHTANGLRLAGGEYAVRALQYDDLIVRQERRLAEIDAEIERINAQIIATIHLSSTSLVGLVLALAQNHGLPLGDSPLQTLQEWQANAADELQELVDRIKTLQSANAGETPRFSQQLEEHFDRYLEVKVFALLLEIAFRDIRQSVH